MSKQITYFCDECFIQKKETNHWFSISLIYKAQTNKETQQFIVTLGLVEKDTHVCGTECLLKKITKLLASVGEESK